MSRDDALAPFEERLGHRFRDRGLLERALTHSSAGSGRDYERLEFLGDRVLGLVVAEMLLARFPDESEGEIGRRFAALVSAETLSEVGGRLGIVELIRTESGTASDGMIADVCEAVIAALYRDGGLEPASAFIRSIWAPLIETRQRPPRDAKTALQEWAQSRAVALPRYTGVGRDGPDHAPIFTVSVSVEGEEPVEAKGQSKRAAEQAAAAIMLRRLGVDEDDG